MFLWTIVVSTWLAPGADESTNQESGEMPIRRSSPDGSAYGFEGAYEGRSIMLGFMDTAARSRFLPFFFEVCIVGSAFSMAQGLITSATLPLVTSKMKLKLTSLRGARVGMERVGHTATTIATLLLRCTQITDLRGAQAQDLTTDQLLYEERQNRLQQRVFKCLALLTAYPVCLLHQALDNRRYADVDSRCEEAVRRLGEIYPIILGDTPLPPSSSQTSTDSWYSTEEYVDTERSHLFEALSLELEMEFRNSRTRNKPPSLAAQQVVAKIRMILENLIDDGHLDPFRSPIVRENIDVMAISGRECLVYSYNDAIPIAFLRVFDTIARGISFSVPFLINVDWKNLAFMNRLFLWFMCGVVGTAGLTILSEISCLWEAFRKGMNTYAWSLGIAREIDKLMEEPHISIQQPITVRKHRYDISYAEAQG